MVHILPVAISLLLVIVLIVIAWGKPDPNHTFAIALWGTLADSPECGTAGDSKGSTSERIDNVA